MTSNSIQTQLSAALALSQFLAENPELPPANWSLHRDGVLSGSIALHADSEQLHAALVAYATVLGGRVREVHFTSPETGPSLSVQLYATWRDVQVSVWGTCVARPAAAEGSAVAA